MIEAAERDGKHHAGRVGDHRADLRQHRRRAGAGVGGQALSPHPDHARQHVARAARAAQGLRRRAAPDAGGGGHARRRRARARACPRQPARLHAAAVQQPGQRRRAPAHDRPRDRRPARGTAARTPSCTAWAPAGRSPASGASCASCAPTCASSPSSRRRAPCCRAGPPGEHRIDGIGAGFVPAILDRSVLSEVRTISERDAQRTKLALARREGLLVGISAGASVKIALDVARELGPGKTRRHHPLRHRRAVLLVGRVFRVSARGNELPARLDPGRRRPRLPGGAGARRRPASRGSASSTTTASTPRTCTGRSCSPTPTSASRR